MATGVAESYVRGTLATTNVDPNLQPGFWMRNIHKVVPAGQAPLAAIMMATGTIMTESKTYNWWQQAFPEQRGTILSVKVTPGGTNYASGAVAGGVLSIAMSVADAQQIVASHQIMLVNSTTGVYFTAIVNEVTISGALTANVNVTLLEDDNGTNDLVFSNGLNSFWLMAQTQSEGGDVPPSLQRQPIHYVNQTQISSVGVSLTGTELVELERVDPDKRTRARLDAAERGIQEQERSIIFGKKYTLFGGTDHEKRFTDGIVSAIKTYSPGNIFNYVTATAPTGTAAYSTWATDGWRFLQDTFEILGRYQESKKTCFGGGLAYVAIQRAIEGKFGIQFPTQPRQTDFGIHVRTLIFPMAGGAGEVDFIVDPMFNTHPIASRSMLVLELPLVKYVTQAGREWKFLTSLYDPRVTFGPDRINEGWRGDFGVKYLNTDALGYITNMGLNHS